MSVVRDNLMTIPNYTPYCGSLHCTTLPRTVWTGEQFKCPHCGWVSRYDEKFINEYKIKWNK